MLISQLTHPGTIRDRQRALRQARRAGGGSRPQAAASAAASRIVLYTFTCELYRGVCLSFLSKDVPAGGRGRLLMEAEGRTIAEVGWAGQCAGGVVETNGFCLKMQALPGNAVSFKFGAGA